MRQESDLLIPRAKRPIRTYWDYYYSTLLSNSVKNKSSNIVPDGQQLLYSKPTTIDMKKAVDQSKKEIRGGVVHVLPTDLKKALVSNPKALKVWRDITPLSRNEWICWVTYVKKPETRKTHVKRAIEELKEGVRRPCCWPGCPHRNPKTKKWFSKPKKTT